MKFSMKMAVLSMAGVLALGGAATAASFIFEQTSVSATVSTDSAIIVKWNESTNQTFTNITGLTNSLAQYKELTIDWSASKLVTGTITLELSLTDINHNINVEVSDTMRSNEGVTADFILSTDTDNDTATQNIDVVSLESGTSKVNSKTYYFKITTTASSTEDLISGTLDAKLGYTATSSVEGA